MLRSLDLFSGIGGITHALDGFATPVMYCEIDQPATIVLRRLMASSKIPKAPIHPDVSKLDGRKLRGKVDLIAAGSPCIGFSSAGKLEGFDNEQSSLYKHVVRLVREIQPSFVFLENVPGILNMGMRHVAKTMATQGYMLTYMTMPAWAVGGVQKRMRWFCLAYKPSAVGKSLPVRKWKWYADRWKKEPCPRMVPTYSRVLKDRMGLLGNSVVPDVVRMAFMMCWTGLEKSALDLRKASAIKLVKPDAGPPVSKSEDTPRQGFVGPDAALRPLPKPLGLRPRPGLRIVLDPKAHRPPSDYEARAEATSGFVTKPQVIDHWATPRHNVGYIAAQRLTNRCMRDLGSQLRFARDTPKALRKGYTNPDWGDWLMGYPVGWTKMS